MKRAAAFLAAAFAVLLLYAFWIRPVEKEMK